jgi:hypothetical protein
MEIVQLIVLGVVVGLLAGLGHVGTNIRIARGTRG